VYKNLKGDKSNSLYARIFTPNIQRAIALWILDTVYKETMRKEDVNYNHPILIFPLDTILFSCVFLIFLLTE
jgi:hypothetical protein